MKPLGRLCVFSPFPMFPDTAGNRIRLKVLCQDLKAAGFEIHFVYHPREDGGQYTAEQLAAHKAICDQVFVAPYLGNYPAPKGLTHVESDIWDPSLEPFARNLFRNVHYDAVIVNYTPFARILTFAPPNCRRILDTHDKLGGRLRMLEEMGQAPNFYYMEDREEGRLLAMAELILSIKDEEAVHYHQVSGGKPVLTVGMNPRSGWGGRQAQPRKINVRQITAGFIGSVNVVNSRAVQAVVSALHRLEAEYPDLHKRFTLNVYGSICNELRDLELPECVALKGFIDEALDFYDEVDIALIPTVRSTGLKIKAVEALNSHCIVMATKDGFSGIRSPHEFHNFETVDDLVSHLLKVLALPNKAGQKALQAMQAATADVLASYGHTYEQSLAALIGALQRPRRVLQVDFQADALGWVRTLVMLRAALPGLSTKFELVLVQPHAEEEHGGLLHGVTLERWRQVKSLCDALPRKPVVVWRAGTEGIDDIPAIEVNPAGLLDTTPGTEQAKQQANQPQNMQELQALTGFVCRQRGRMRPWLPKCGYVHHYWGKNCVVTVLLDGVRASEGVPIIRRAQERFAGEAIRLPLEFVVAENAMAGYAELGIKAVGLPQWLSKPMANRFNAVVDLGQGSGLGLRSLTAYTLNRAFYVVDSRSKAESVRALRGDGCAVTWMPGPQQAISHAAWQALSEERFQELNTHLHKKLAFTD